MNQRLYQKRIDGDCNRPQTSMEDKPDDTIVLRDAGHESLEKNERRLWNEKGAIECLTKTFGLQEQTIRHFHLGLSHPYEYEGKLIHEKVLVAPLKWRDGKFKGNYFNHIIPGVTVDNRIKQVTSWFPGAAQCYYSDRLGDQSSVFICSGIKELWILWQLIQRKPLAKDLLLISSTKGDGAFPSAFWKEFDKVYCGHNNEPSQQDVNIGDAHAMSLTKTAARECLRVTPGSMKTWHEWYLAGASYEQFTQLLQNARPVVLEDLRETKMEIRREKERGRFAYNPVQNISNAYHNGYLYYAATTYRRDIVEETREDGLTKEEITERKEVIVIRSDGTQHKVVRSKLPRGAAMEDRILRLSDGTLIENVPRRNPYGTWEWDETKFSIMNFLKGCPNKPRPLAAIIRDLVAYFRSCIWLPTSEDYVMLAFVVPVSYAQRIFDAVPHIFVNGPAGSGKSELARALSNVCANATMLGGITGATLARQVNICQGFVALDDMEKLAVKKGEAQFQDLPQILKLSYNKYTAKKIITLPNGEPVEFDFYGVKLINNTRGVGDILGSRMLHIDMRTLPSNVTLPNNWPNLKLRELRNELHTWTFLGVAEIADTYRKIMPVQQAREFEITAPLKVMAELARDDELKALLDAALKLQASKKGNHDSPEAVLGNALETILFRSIRAGTVQLWVSITELAFQIQLLIGRCRDRAESLNPKLLKPEWISRQLRLSYADPEVYDVKNTFGQDGHRRSIRAYKLSDAYIKGVITRFGELYSNEPVPQKTSSDFRAFCSGCPKCNYIDVCSVRKEISKKRQ